MSIICCLDINSKKQNETEESGFLKLQMQASKKAFITQENKTFLLDAKRITNDLETRLMIVITQERTTVIVSSFSNTRTTTCHCCFIHSEPCQLGNMCISVNESELSDPNDQQITFSPLKIPDRRPHNPDPMTLLEGQNIFKQEETLLSKDNPYKEMKELRNTFFTSKCLPLRKSKQYDIIKDFVGFINCFRTLYIFSTFQDTHVNNGCKYPSSPLPCFNNQSKVAELCTVPYPSPNYTPKLNVNDENLYLHNYTRKFEKLSTGVILKYDSMTFSHCWQGKLTNAKDTSKQISNSKFEELTQSDDSVVRSRTMLLLSRDIFLHDKVHWPVQFNCRTSKHCALYSMFKLSHGRAFNLSAWKFEFDLCPLQTHSLKQAKSYLIFDKFISITDKNPTSPIEDLNEVEHKLLLRYFGNDEQRIFSEVKELDWNSAPICFINLSTRLIEICATDFYMHSGNQIKFKFQVEPYRVLSFMNYSPHFRESEARTLARLGFYLVYDEWDPPPERTPTIPFDIASTGRNRNLRLIRSFPHCKIKCAFCREEFIYTASITPDWELFCINIKISHAIRSPLCPIVLNNLCSNTTPSLWCSNKLNCGTCELPTLNVDKELYPAAMNEDYSSIQELMEESTTKSLYDYNSQPAKLLQQFFNDISTLAMKIDELEQEAFNDQEPDSVPILRNTALENSVLESGR